MHDSRARPPQPFDVFASPLDGVNLIEASAGTGKTWSICGLYLRLLLERDFGVEDILVVTFTNAATAELRDRIRTRIAEALDTLRAGTGAAAPDAFIGELIESLARNAGPDRAMLVARLDYALQSFDQAAICTIHGFCQRALADAAFTAGVPFALEALTDDDELRLEATRDYWRSHIAGGDLDAALAAWLSNKGDSPETYAEIVKRCGAKPLAQRRWPDAGDAPPIVDTVALDDAYAAARRIWGAERAAIIARLEAGIPAALKASIYKSDSVREAEVDWEAFLAAGSPFAKIEKTKVHLFSARKLADSTKQNQVAPSHPFFDAVDALLECREAAEEQLERARTRLVRSMVEHVVPDLRARKRARRVLAFDDMLYNLHAALEGGAGTPLAAALRQRFPVALIDEFQDTDPLQFAVFERIYGAQNLPLFLVGDPKQAIYSFRHADLYTYLRARTLAQSGWTLAENQRSTPGLIAAINGVFGNNPRAFFLRGLDYHRVTPGRKPRPVLRDDSQPRADLQVWTLPLTEAGEALRKAEASAAAALSVGAEIARLLAESAAGRITLDGRPLQAHDIAILVATHRQGNAMKQALAALRIGSVELSHDSIFGSREAEEVARILAAIADPSRDALVRAALATEILGYDAAAVAVLGADEAAIGAVTERFAGYRDAWLRDGIGVMYRRFAAAEGVSARLLARPDGERRLTNVLHLGEQLHQAAAVHDSPAALLRWLDARRRDGSSDDVAQLRLESDRNLVQIVTIHKAKGLEFPVVFCPYLWDGLIRVGKGPPDGIEYHDADGNAVIDFRILSETEKCDVADQIRFEKAAEQLRVIYVALTRAALRCYLVAGTYAIGSSVKESNGALLNWLVAGLGSTPQAWLAGGRTIAQVHDAWTALAARLAPHLRVDSLPDRAGIPLADEGASAGTLQALTPPPPIASDWRITSFSALASNASHDAAATDHDGRVVTLPAQWAAPPAAVAADDILRFPRGRNAGDCLHAMFERIDFTDPARWSDAIAAALAAHPQALPRMRAADQRPLLAQMAANMLRDVTAATLPGDIRLDAITPAQRLTELEFSLPSPRVSAATLNDALRALGYEVPRLAFSATAGYLKGFVDLVFEHRGRYYIIDWKSNHLGYTIDDYDRAAVAAAMAEHGYHLQYLLYCVALDRYLRHRLRGYEYATHFGGVLYLFVRGVRPQWRHADGTPAGVYHHCPAPQAIARLDALLGRPATR